MGVRSERRARFFRDHPVCCYCSGRRATTEVDHNPHRGLFPKGGVPKDLRFPSCSECNAKKKDAESRAALVASVFCRLDPPDASELKRSVDRGLGFFERDADFRSAIAEHHIWDFARGAPPAQSSDPLAAMDTPHTLPASFGRALLELGRFFGQALYYRVTKRVMTAKQMVGVALITNAASQEVREVALALGETLKLFVPEPVDRNQPPLFAFGAAFFWNLRRSFSRESAAAHSLGLASPASWTSGSLGWRNLISGTVMARGIKRNSHSDLRPILRAPSPDVRLRHQRG